MKCWDNNPDARPSFQEVLETLQGLQLEIRKLRRAKEREAQALAIKTKMEEVEVIVEEDEESAADATSASSFEEKRDSPMLSPVVVSPKTTEV